VWGTALRKCLQTYDDANFCFLFWCGELNPESLCKHFRFTLYIPLDDVNITNRCNVCLQHRMILHVQDKASVKSLHNKYCVKNGNNK
jgi:hypothetical protein